MCSSAPPPGRTTPPPGTGPTPVTGQQPIQAGNMRLDVPPGPSLTPGMGASAVSSTMPAAQTGTYNPWQQGGGAAIGADMQAKGMDPTKYDTSGNPIDMSFAAGMANNGSNMVNTARDAAAARIAPTPGLVPRFQTGGVDPRFTPPGRQQIYGDPRLPRAPADANVTGDPRAALVNALMRRR